MFHVKHWKKGFTVEERFFWRIATLALRLGRKVLLGDWHFGELLLGLKF
jgi:hypothetical protein